MMRTEEEIEMVEKSLGDVSGVDRHPVNPLIIEVLKWVQGRSSQFDEAFDLALAGQRAMRAGDLAGFNRLVDRNLQ